MAFGGSQSWELLCPVCKTFIETNNYGDLQASLDYHYLNVHPKLRGTSQSDNYIPVLKDMKFMNENNVNRLRKECTSYIICPVCDSVVQIFQNSINHCLMEHFELYHQNVLKFDAADRSSVQRRREHSTESFESAENKNPLSDLQNVTSKSCSSNLFDLPSDLKKHSGYIIFNDNCFLCHICRETSNTQQIVEDHLKTKKHEDNVIIWLKNILPKHMHSAMEFVSFYGSDLCCNLCRCKIDLNSINPHETLLNIISHNTDAKHSQTKSHRDPKESNVGYTILKSVTEKNTLINEHKDFIETEMEPRFKCKLCGKTIHFSKSNFELEQNFLTHINSVLHSKNSKAMTVLQFFKEMNGDRVGRHCFSVLNGAIDCTQCKCTIMANVEQLLEHCQSYANVEISQSPEKKNNDYAPLTSNNSLITNKSNLPLEISSETTMTCETISGSHLNSSDINPSKINRTKEMKKSYVKEILYPLQNQFGNITCIAENEDGKLTCLICNCSVQPSTHCVKMHLMGKFHKNKTQCQIKELNTLNLNNGETDQELNLNNGGNRREPFQDLIEQLFQSLPRRYQEEKDFCSINLTDGSINCLLCNCTIDPLLIELHLQKETHLQQKKLGRLGAKETVGVTCDYLMQDQFK